MRNRQRIWRGKTDDELMAAAAALSDYTVEGERVIRAELRRRGLTEPPSTERSTIQEGSQRTEGRPPYGAVVALVGVALFIAPFPLFSLLAAPAAIIGAFLAGKGKLRAARGVALSVVVATLLVSVPMLISSYGAASDRAYMTLPRWIGVFLAGGPMAALMGLLAVVLLGRALAGSAGGAQDHRSLPGR